MGRARSMVNVAETGRRKEGFAVRTTNPDHLVSRVLSPTNVSFRRVAARYAARRPRARRADNLREIAHEQLAARRIGRSRNIRIERDSLLQLGRFKTWTM
jgi:hypothetical protein